MYRTILSTLAAATLVAPLGGQVVISRNGAATARGFTFSTNSDRDGRAMLGVSTSSGSKRDTLGVLVAAVTEDGPAEKAGIHEGDRLQSINGVSLKVSRDDAGDDEMGGIMQRRLTRELGKLKAGDEATLVVWSSGASKTIKVKTAEAGSFGARTKRTRDDGEDRAVIGIGYSLTGSKRDTAGVFVNSVTEDSPAEKAGIVEGDRIAAVNGVSLRSTKDDIEDGIAGNAKMNRLSREMNKLKAGDAVELTVISGGRSRTVKVTTVKASALKSSGFNYSFTVPPMPPMAAMAPMAPMAPTAPMPRVAPRVMVAPQVPGMRWRSMDDEDDVDPAEVRREVQRAMKEAMPSVNVEVRKHLEATAKELQGLRLRLSTGRVVDM